MSIYRLTEILKSINKTIPFTYNSSFDESSIYKLSELKPAGTKLILEPSSDIIELLKLTLFDLTLKQVLIIKKEFKRLHLREPHLREYLIVETGKNFTKYKPCQFEKYFTKRIDEDSYFQLKSYLRAIHKDISSEFIFKKEIVNDLKTIEFFKNDFVSSFFLWFRTNSKGKKLKVNFEEYLNEIDENIGDLIENEPDKAKELLQFLQGNIFLLKNLKFELLEKLDFKNNNNSANEYDYSDCILMDFMNDSEFVFSDVFSDISNVFDSVDSYVGFDSAGDFSGDFDFD